MMATQQQSCRSRRVEETKAAELFHSIITALKASALLAARIALLYLESVKVFASAPSRTIAASADESLFCGCRLPPAAVYY